MQLTLTTSPATPPLFEVPLPPLAAPLPPPPPALPELPPPFRRLLSQPMCLSSPMRVISARLASTRERCVLLPMAEWSALNQTRASAESAARRMHECTPSGECSSRQRFSTSANIVEFRTTCTGQRPLTRIDVLEIARQMRQLQRYVARICSRRCLGRRCWRGCRRARTQWAEECALQLPAHLRNDARLPKVGRHLAQKFNCKYRHQYMSP